MAQEPTTAGAGTTYNERLYVPWWLWPVALGLAALFAAEVFLGANPALAWIPYAILIPGTAAGLIALGRIRVRVTAGGPDGPELEVDDAHIPMTYITEVNVLDRAAKISLLGPLSAPDVFTVQRPWIPGAVRVVIDDPADPTPYWIISSRRPAELARAIAASLRRD